MVRKHQVVVPLVAVGFYGTGVHADHAPPDNPRVVLQSSLVEQVAGALGHLVVLHRVVGKVLAAFGEHHAVDLGFGPPARECHVLVHLGQPGPQGADGPLNPALLLYHGPMVGKVPYPLGPVLQAHQAE